MAWRLVFRNNLGPIYANVRSSGIHSDLFVECCRQHLLCDSKQRIHSSAPGHSPTKTGEQSLQEKKLVDKVKTAVGHGLIGSEDLIGENDGSKGHGVQHTSLEGHSPTKTRGRPRQKKLTDEVDTHVGHGHSPTKTRGRPRQKKLTDEVDTHVGHGHSPTKTKGRPREKKLSDKLETLVGHEPASIEDIADVNGPVIYCTSRQALRDEKYRAEIDEIDKQSDPRNWGAHEGGKVFLNGVCYDSARDPTYIKKSCENFVKVAKSMVWDVPPGQDSLYETLCRLRGRRPFTEDPEYQKEQWQEAARLEARRRRKAQEAARLEARRRRKAQQREKSSSLS